MTEPTLGNITVRAATTAAYLGIGPEPPLSASAQAIVNDVDYTTGPVRSGFIQISETISSLHSLVSTDWSIKDGPYAYSSCLPGPSNSQGCHGTATLPFQLGVPFTVNATAMDGLSIMPPTPGFGQDDLVNLTFSLFEANGTTPVAVMPTPEPSTFALLLSAFALSALYMCRRLNRRA